jgi:hypothetical protein
LKSSVTLELTGRPDLACSEGVPLGACNQPSTTNVLDILPTLSFVGYAPKQISRRYEND